MLQWCAFLILYRSYSIAISMFFFVFGLIVFIFWIFFQNILLSFTFDFLSVLINFYYFLFFKFLANKSLVNLWWIHDESMMNLRVILVDQHFWLLKNPSFLVKVLHITFCPRNTSIFILENPLFLEDFSSCAIFPYNTSIYTFVLPSITYAYFQIPLFHGFWSLPFPRVIDSDDYCFMTFDRG